MDDISKFNLSLGDLRLLQQIVEYHTNRHRYKLSILIKLIQQTATVHRCMARIHDNTQCTRKYKDMKTQLCGSHANSLPYGRIDDNNTNIKLPEKKTKGRKAKNKNMTPSDQIDLSKFIKTEMITINGTDYLVDDNNIIFENDDMNTILGRKKSENQYEWF
jgi:hypothetical protein